LDERECPVPRRSARLAELVPQCSLQDLIDGKSDLLDYFYSDTLAPHYRARTSLTAAFIPPEFTNYDGVEWITRVKNH